MTLSTATQPAPALDRDTPVRDVRPILERTRDNAWERTEQFRTEVYHLLEVLCARRQLEALVLQSPPYVHPAWVKFESWSPTGEDGITARASITVGIATRPYHRYEAVYKIEWERHGQKGAFDQVYELGESELGTLIDLAMAAPTPSLTRRAVKRILKPVQLRQQWWQFWKPRNTVTIIRRDWAVIAGVGSVLLGLSLLAVAYQDQASFPGGDIESTFDSSIGTDPLSTGATTVPAEPPVADPPPATTERDASSSFERMVLGQPVTGALDEADQRFDDGRLYEARAFAGRAGSPVVITLGSSEFDTYLVLGRFVGGTFLSLQTNDDGGGDGTNSRLEFTPGEDGEYIVVASSLEPGKTGSYLLSVR